MIGSRAGRLHSQAPGASRDNARCALLRSILPPTLPEIPIGGLVIGALAMSTRSALLGAVSFPDQPVTWAGTVAAP